ALFCLYITPLSYFFYKLFCFFNHYADDTQLYISFSSSDSVSNLNTLSSTLDSVYTWLSSNRLSVNSFKTEDLLAACRQSPAMVKTCFFFNIYIYFMEIFLHLLINVVILVLFLIVIF